ncbi:TolC family protein [Parahaliea mediterranea]|uniref:TolC family protein n=1 Tax=Parahaliea mediterranea TaxID=651086 RepID=UPI000E2F3135|nr:TolC family protein [Parahaliea mediterranea]
MNMTSSQRARAGALPYPAWLLCLALLCLAAATPASAAAGSGLSLQQASQRALAQNPALQVFDWRQQALEGQRESAGLRPQTTLALEAENLAGSGEFSGVDAAEVTLSLSSVIELGGQLASRLAVADSRLALNQAQRQADALDLLGEVARRFVTVQAQQARLDIARSALALAERSLKLVRQRVDQGAAPLAEALRAEAAVAQARLRQNALRAELAADRNALAALWGAEQPDFDTLQGALFTFPDVGPLEPAFERLRQSPLARVYSSEKRQLQAEVDLARANARQDIGWSAGLRRLEQSSDTALTLGLSLPLFQERRSRGEVRAAMAERSAADYREQSALLAMHTQLNAAWQRYQQGSAAASTLRTAVIPLLQQASEETRAAYEQGRSRYLDWAESQRELIDTRYAAVDAASEALLNLATLEQLTGQSIGATSDSASASSDASNKANSNASTTTAPRD